MNSMRILYLSFTDKNFDSRTRDLLEVAHGLGEIFYVGMAKTQYVDEKNCVVGISSNKIISFIKFVIVALKCAVQQEYHALFIDNYHASLCALIIRLFRKHLLIIQDVRELYLPENLPSVFGKMLVRCEKRLMKQADVVICANDIRSKICKGMFHLENFPIVFENIHWFNNSEGSKHEEKDGSIKVVITDGLSRDRMSDECISAINSLDKRFHFYIVGAVSEKEVAHARSLIDVHKLDHLHLVGKLDYLELGKFVSKCDIGIVKYNFNDLNNIFCASGKIYEFLMSGLPVVTTEQIVLKDLCSKYGVGVADNGFSDGLTEVADNIDRFKLCVKNYQHKVMLTNYIDDCKQSIKEQIGLI